MGSKCLYAVFLVQATHLFLQWSSWFFGAPSHTVEVKTTKGCEVGIEIRLHRETFGSHFCLFVLLRSLLVLAVINQLFKRFAWNYIHTHLILHHIYEFFVVDHAISIHVYTLQKLLDLVLSQGEVVAGKTLTKLFRADWAAVILVEIGESRSQMALFQVVVTREASCYELGVVNEPVLIRVYRAHGVQNITFW